MQIRLWVSLPTASDMQQKTQENLPQPSWIPFLCSQAQPHWPASCLQASSAFRFCTYSSLCLELSALDLPWPAPHPPHHSVYTYTLFFRRGHCWPDPHDHSIPSLASLHSHHHDLYLPDLFIYFLHTSHTHTHTHTHRHKLDVHSIRTACVSTQSGTWPRVSAQWTLRGKCECAWKWLHGASPPTTTKLSPASEKENESSYSALYSAPYSAPHTLWPVPTPSGHTPVIHTMDVQVSRNL